MQSATSRATPQPSRPVDTIRADVGDLYLAIAFLKECNLKCGYCHPFGESKITHGTNMRPEELRDVLDASHDAGFRVYRFTGGECTIVPWFEKSLRHAMELPDTRVNVCTNGTTLERHADLFTEYRDRVSLRVSLDSTKDTPYGSIEKVLTPSVRAGLERIARDGVYARFNTVVTSENVDEVPSLISFAASLGLDVKLLDLYVQDEYIATEKKNAALTPAQYWDRSYVDLTTLVPQLSAAAADPSIAYNRDGGFGIPMYSFDIDGITVILKDSTKGAHFSATQCIAACNQFGVRCQEGVYTPHVSSNMVLHVNGCANTQHQWPLRDKTRAEQRGAFGDIIETFFRDLVHVTTPPKTIQDRQLVQLTRRAMA